jgi:RNA polymerase sigma-70 factor, ECF subfamily
MIGKLAEPGDGFVETILPHLNSAYNLARWLVRNGDDAEDVAQEAYLRAFRYFDTFHGGNARAWLLTIVRNTYHSWLHENRAHQPAVDFDEQLHSGNVTAENPETSLIQSVNNELVAQALRDVPDHFREVLVLRELQELSYKQISEAIGVPVGTVMSRLSRARERLRQAFGDLGGAGGLREAEGAEAIN